MKACLEQSIQTANLFCGVINITTRYRELNEWTIKAADDKFIRISDHGTGGMKLNTRVHIS